MATKNKNLLLWGGLLALAGGGFYLWNRSRKNKDLEPLPEASPKNDGGGSLPPPPADEFPGKVRTLQTLLGFTGRDVDGSAGPATNKAAAERIGISPITLANIDAAITKAEAVKKTQGDAAAEKAKTASRLGKSWALKKSFDKNKAFRLTLLKPGSFLERIENKATGTWPGTGKSVELNARAFSRSELSEVIVLSDGHILVKYNGFTGTRYLFAHPDNFILT